MPKPLPTTNKRNDGYVGVLFFTALIMGGGVLMMYLENDEYQFEHEVKAAAPQKVSSLLKMKAPSPETPAAPPADAPQSRRLPVLPPVIIPPAAPVAAIPAAPPSVPVEVTPMPRAVDASAPRENPEAKPVEAGPPVLQPGFTLPRRR
jgi:hypothetical protein